MCDTCGCGQSGNQVTLRKPGSDQHLHPHTHHHAHDHDHSHSYSHSHSHSHEPNEISIEQNLLSENQRIAEQNRGYFRARGIRAINLVSSPGSGKTSLLEKTLQEIKGELPVYVIEGDQTSMQDAERIAALGVESIQINTGDGCHLDAAMIQTAVESLNIQDNSLLFIENVGNLVCPALFDLGEQERVVIISVTEGDDKPLKYPNMFHTSQLCLINKTDLLPYVDFDTEKAKKHALNVNHHLSFMEVSAKSGEGMESWYAWLRKQH